MLVIVMTVFAFSACTKNYTVNFDGNGGELISGEVVQIIKEGQNAIPPEFKKEGYTFLGWDTDYQKIKKNMTITAIWDSNFEFTAYTENGYDGYVVSGMKVINDEWTDIVVPDLL